VNERQLVIHIRKNSAEAQSQFDDLHQRNSDLESECDNLSHEKANLKHPIDGQAVSVSDRTLQIDQAKELVEVLPDSSSGTLALAHEQIQMQQRDIDSLKAECVNEKEAGEQFERAFSDLRAQTDAVSSAALAQVRHFELQLSTEEVGHEPASAALVRLSADLKVSQDAYSALFTQSRSREASLTEDLSRSESDAASKEIDLLRIGNWSGHNPMSNESVVADADKKGWLGVFQVERHQAIDESI
jgi:hypothetical protein